MSKLLMMSVSIRNRSTRVSEILREEFCLLAKKIYELLIGSTIELKIEGQYSAKMFQKRPEFASARGRFFK